MDKSKRILYQFPLSLYCEKTRWNLDAKGLNYTCRDLLPGPHAFMAWRLARQRCLPILCDERQTVGDSTTIALYLEHHYPESPLLPNDPIVRQQVLKLEEEFDTLGDHVRRFCWSMVVDSPEVSDIFFGFTGYTRWQQILAAYSRPLLRLMIRRTFKVYEPRISDSWLYIQNALQQIEQLLQGRADRYLVGDHFTLADLTAASMLAPLIGPNNSPWSDHRIPQVAQQQRAELRARLVGQWVWRLYHDHRSHPHDTPHRVTQEQL
ncbi:glutathione S-transferase family protein [Aquirhabdus sp.]|uniref:glutathione S-transferase family protein n=1 Tax=Aquirhabdus sp. TaxID=2824160 RepID=UPI00396CBC6D